MGDGGCSCLLRSLYVNFQYLHIEAHSVNVKLLTHVVLVWCVLFCVCGYVVEGDGCGGGWTHVG